ncbi:MAG: ATP-binding cassette domain-containing protein [Actinomycetales bacterium]
MTPVLQLSHLTKRYRETVALDDVTVAFEENTICGLLGRNGAGKTSLMSIATAQNVATSGSVRAFGEAPYENAAVLQRMCFVRESQPYPEDARPGHAFAAAGMFFPRWDAAFARQLARDFELPMNRRIKKLSRGQLSAVGVIIGLASRAEITFFDEPYLGLDAVARQLFYDRLLADYGEHPRTIVLSSHLIDEVANLLETVVLLDHGRLVLDDDVEAIRGGAVSVIGAADAVEQFTLGRDVIHRERLGGTASVTVLGRLTDAERRELLAVGLEMAPVSLQQLIVRLTDGEHTAELKGASA